MHNFPHPHLALGVMEGQLISYPLRTHHVGQHVHRLPSFIHATWTQRSAVSVNIMRAQEPERNTPNGVFPAMGLEGRITATTRNGQPATQLRAIYDLALENIEHEGGESTPAPHAEFHVDIVEMLLYGVR